jgi:hypothetical protein
LWQAAQDLSQRARRKLGRSTGAGYHFGQSHLVQSPSMRIAQ